MFSLLRPARFGSKTNPAEFGRRTALIVSYYRGIRLNYAQASEITPR
jgi:hypothetical protein